MAKIEKIKVLIADDDNQLSRRLADYISDRGFDARITHNGTEAINIINDWKPKFVLADLMLPEQNAMALMDHVKNEHRLRHHFINVIVMSGHNNRSNVTEAFRRGAKDYLVKPFKHDDVLKRLIFHCRGYRHLKDLSQKEFTKVDEASLMLHLTDLVLRQANTPSSIQDKLFNLTRMVSMKVNGVRCSIINCLDQVEGVVVASNDNKEASGIRLDLNKYPEVLNVLNTGQLIAIENIEQSAQLKSIKKLLHDVNFNSMVVCPIFRAAQAFGVISLRLPPEKETLSDNEIRFIEIVSHVVSLVLSNENQVGLKDFWLENSPAKPIPFLPPRGAKKTS